MGKPVDFKESNFTWKGWGQSAERDEVLDLPSHYDPQTRQTISCWKLGWKERLRVLLTGRVWLHVFGKQPPVYVNGEFPFIHQDQ